MKTVLDVGAYSGEASKEYVEPGDTWILVDNQQYLGYEGWGVPSTPKEAKLIICDIMDYKEPADVIVCSNVVYHVPDPIALLRHLHKLTKKLLYLKTYYNPPGADDWTFYDPKKNPAHQHPPTAATIYYRPTAVGLEKALREVGFTDIKIVVG